MSEPTGASARNLEARVVQLYQAIAVLMIVAIGVLVAYAIRLGPLVGPGVENSFGLAVGLMFLCSAMIVHVVDRTYRVWPTGRRVSPVTPGWYTDRSVAAFLRIVVLVAVGGAIAYVVATLMM